MNSYNQGLQIGYKKALSFELSLPPEQQNKKLIETLNSLILC